jgi:hypothetical protein
MNSVRIAPGNPQPCPGGMAADFISDKIMRQQEDRAPSDSLEADGAQIRRPV